MKCVRVIRLWWQPRIEEVLRWKEMGGKTVRKSRMRVL